MKIPKRYGQSRDDACPFCGQKSTTKNTQGIPVCPKHKSAILNDMKCACGDYLDIMQGKYGFFFRCMKCGCISPKKAFELNEIKDVSGIVESFKKKEFSNSKSNPRNSISSNKSNSSYNSEKKSDINSNKNIYNDADEFIIPTKASKKSEKSSEKDLSNTFITDDVEVVRSDDPKYFD